MLSRGGFTIAGPPLAAARTGGSLACRVAFLVLLGPGPELSFGVTKELAASNRQQVCGIFDHHRGYLGHHEHRSTPTGTANAKCFIHAVSSELELRSGGRWLVPTVQLALRFPHFIISVVAAVVSSSSCTDVWPFTADLCCDL